MQPVITKKDRTQRSLAATEQSGGRTCDFGGMTKLIIDVPLPLALSRALINCMEEASGA
jgi:hypothetical protein